MKRIGQWPIFQWGNAAEFIEQLSHRSDHGTTGSPPYLSTGEEGTRWAMGEERHTWQCTSTSDFDQKKNFFLSSYPWQTRFLASEMNPRRSQAGRAAESAWPQHPGGNDDPQYPLWSTRTFGQMISKSFHKFFLLINKFFDDCLFGWHIRSFFDVWSLSLRTMIRSKLNEGIAGGNDEMVDDNPPVSTVQGKMPFLNSYKTHLSLEKSDGVKYRRIDFLLSRSLHRHRFLVVALEMIFTENLHSSVVYGAWKENRHFSFHRRTGLLVSFDDHCSKSTELTWSSGDHCPSAHRRVDLYDLIDEKWTRVLALFIRWAWFFHRNDFDQPCVGVR